MYYKSLQYFMYFCYANTSKKAVMDNMGKHSNDSESIIG